MQIATVPTQCLLLCLQAGEKTGGDKGPAWSDEAAEGTDAWPGERDWGS